MISMTTLLWLGGCVVCLLAGGWLGYAWCSLGAADKLALLMVHANNWRATATSAERKLTELSYAYQQELDERDRLLANLKRDHDQAIATLKSKQEPKQ